MNEQQILLSTSIFIVALSILTIYALVRRVRLRLKNEGGVIQYLSSESYGNEFELLAIAFPVVSNVAFYAMVAVNSAWAITFEARMINRWNWIMLLIVLSIYFLNGVLAKRLRALIDKWIRYRL